MFAHVPEDLWSQLELKDMETTLSYHLQQQQQHHYQPDELADTGIVMDANVGSVLIQNNSDSSEASLYGVHNYPLVWKIVIGTIIAGVSITTFLGNILVVVAFATQTKLRTFGNYFILNLAFTDLIVGILMGVYLPTMMVGEWLYGREVCTVFILFDYIVPLASSWNIAVISFDRYWCVSHPSSYRVHSTKNYVWGIMAIPWIAGTLTFVPAEIYWQFFQQPYLVPPNQCYIAFYTYTPYLLFSSAMEFILPFIVVLVLNLLLVSNIMKRSRMARKFRSPHLAQKRLSRDKSAAKSLAILVVIFGITWGPFEVCQLYNALKPSGINTILYEVVFWMLWINSTVNPILYALLQERFRIAFKKVLYLVFGCCAKQHRVVSDVKEYTEYNTRLILNGESRNGGAGNGRRNIELQVVRPEEEEGPTKTSTGTNSL